MPAAIRPAHQACAAGPLRHSLSGNPKKLTCGYARISEAASRNHDQVGEVAERIKKLASNGGYKWRRLWTLETRGSLIGSDKVQGTAVYEADDRKIGSVQRVMI